MMGSSLSLKPKPPRTNSKKNMLITLTRRASRAMSSRRAWLSTSGGDADGGGMGQEPGKDPEVLAARRRENMEAFKAFRKVARGFRWPNEAAPSSTTATTAAREAQEVREDAGANDVEVPGGPAADGGSDGLGGQVGQGDGRDVDRDDRDDVFGDEDLFGEDGDPRPFHELMALADQEREMGPDMKGRKNFGRVIRKDISERDVLTLSMFVNELGRIQPRHVTGLTAKQQRKVAKMVKRARHMGVMPHMFRLPPEFAFTSPVHDMAEIERVKAWEEARAGRD
jgi:small subunit ribosomal protein S18